MKHSVSKKKPVKSRAKTTKRKTKPRPKTGGGPMMDSLKLAYLIKKTKIPKK